MAKTNESNDSKNEKITPAGESSTGTNDTTNTPSAASTTTSKEDVNPASSTDSTPATPSSEDKASDSGEASKKPAAKKGSKEEKAVEPAVAPEPVAVKPLNFGFKQWTKDEAKKLFEGKSDQLAVLAMSLTKLFYDADQTILANPTEKQVLEFVGPQANQFDIKFEFADDENLSGKISIKEFDEVIVLPYGGGLFTFGKDYSIGS